jgi:hypothetical protein
MSAKSADALIDQPKQKNPNCPCSGRVTANPEITANQYPRISVAEVITSGLALPDWRRSDRNLKIALYPAR